MPKKNIFKMIIIISILLHLLFTGCTDFKDQKIQENDVWVFLTIRYNTNEDYNFDYYFGSVDKDLYKKISENRINQGFITIKNIRYWMDKKIEIYEDDQDADSRTYRIEDIREIKLKKGDPIYLYSNEDLSEEAKLFVAENPKTFLDTLIQE
jgi:hypothetical protein